MQLSDDTIKALIHLQDTNTLSDEVFQQILEDTILHVCKSVTDFNGLHTQNSKEIGSKDAFANIVCLFVEAARRDLSEEGLLSFFNGAKITGSRVEKLCDAYSKNKKAIQAQLELIGNGLPHIVDVNWRLDYCVKVGTCNSVGLPLYRVKLSTRKHNADDSITFTCTTQQLQDLVSKVKDAVRHLEKLSNV